MTGAALYPAGIALASLGALASAYTAQYGFGLQPCILCLYQRVPFAAAGVLGVLALLPALRPGLRAGLLALAGLGLLANAGIAVFHTGVEQHWWAGTEACSGGAAATAAMTMEQLQEMLSRPAQARCDQPPWSFHGLTMAMLNVPFSAALGLFGLWGARRLTRGRR